MNLPRSYLLLLLLLLLSHLTYVRNTEAAINSVRDLIAIGLENNISLQVEQLDVPIAAEAVQVEDAAFDAELFASSAFVDSTTPIASSMSLVEQNESEVFSAAAGLNKLYRTGLFASLSLDTEWTDDNNFSDDLAPRYRSGLNLSLTQPLWRDFGVQANTSSLVIAQNQNAQAALDVQLQAQSLALQIEMLTVKLAGETSVLQLREEAVALADKLYAANQRRYETGVIPVSEVQEAATALASRQLDLSQSSQVKALLIEDLRRVLNFQLSTPLDFSSLYPFEESLLMQQLPNEELLYDAAQAKSIRLQIVEKDAQNANVRRTFFRNQLQPRLDLKLQAGLSGLSGEERSTAVSSRYAGDWPESITKAGEADGHYWGAGLEFSLPLGNRLAKSRLRQAELQRKQVGYHSRDIEEELRSELIKQRVNLQKAFEQMEIAKRFESLARLSLQQEQRRLEEGLSDTFRIINFQDNMISAKVGRIIATVQYFIGLAQMNYTRGIILEQHNISLAQMTKESSFEN